MTLAKPALPGRAAAILPPQPNPALPKADPGGVTLYGSGVWIPRPVEESARAADKVALVTVTAVGPGFWTTPDGQRPSSLTPETAQTQQIQAAILTPISVRVVRGIKRAVVGETLTFAVSGGKAGPDLYYMFTEPRFQVGDSLLLLLDAPASLPGSGRAVTAVRDVFRTTPQGRAIALHYRADLDLQDMIARIAAAVSP